jgi:ABC-type dipeptide/oligopeptide/nickel transport system permease component
VVEAVFSWPGIGKLAIDAVSAEDLPMLMGTVLFASLCVVLANLAVDLLIAVTDPRVQLRGRG